MKKSNLLRVAAVLLLSALAASLLTGCLTTSYTAELKKRVEADNLDKTTKWFGENIPGAELKTCEIYCDMWNISNLAEGDFELDGNSYHYVLNTDTGVAFSNEQYARLEELMLEAVYSRSKLGDELRKLELTKMDYNIDGYTIEGDYVMNMGHNSLDRKVKERPVREAMTQPVYLLPRGLSDEALQGIADAQIRSGSIEIEFETEDIEAAVEALQLKDYTLAKEFDNIKFRVWNALAAVPGDTVWYLVYAPADGYLLRRAYYVEGIGDTPEIIYEDTEFRWPER